MFTKRKKETTNEGLSLAPNMPALEVEKGTVLFDSRRGRYSQFNELGLIVVKLLGGAMGADAIVRRVVEAYNISARTADADVRASLVQVKELGTMA